MSKSKQVDHRPRLERTSLVGDLIASGACSNLIIHAPDILTAQRGLMMTMLDTAPVFYGRLPIALICHPDHLPARGGMGLDHPPRKDGQIAFAESAFRLRMEFALQAPDLMVFDPFAGQAYQVVLVDSIPIGMFQFVLPTVARLS